MSIRPGTVSLVTASGSMIAAFAVGSDAIGMAAMALGGIGAAMYFPAAQRWLSGGRASSEMEDRLSEMEKRLRLTEAELEAATSQVARLTEERDFDRQLSGTRQ